MRDIQAHIEEVCQRLFDQQVEVQLDEPEEQFGDYATNVAMRLAKQLGQNPREIAQQIVDSLSHEAIKQADIAGPGFINIRLHSPFVADTLKSYIDSKTFAVSDVGNGKTVVSEFPSVNIAKPYSVGHLRSASQGWAVAQLMRRMGYDVITDNHLGDYGTPFGKWVVGFLHFSSESALEEKGIYELARVYVEITEALKKEQQTENTELTDEIQSWLKRLESKDEEAVAYSERFKKISLEHFHSVMGRLRISTDFELGESFYIKHGQELVDELLQKDVAVESEGAIVVPLDEYGIETPVMLRKANGAALYATSDLATIEYRQQNWSPEKVFIHTGEEQVFYFQQLKALAKKSGYEDTIEHLWHGIIDQINLETGKREKMSSRKGVVLLEELLDAAENEARKNMKDGDEEDIQAVTLAAIKFTDFIADRKRGLLFDWDSMFSVQGFSGPAIQYAVVRIKAIKQKAGKDSLDINGLETYDWSAEHQLLIKCLAYHDLLLELHESYELHKLATYLYELARLFNRYYEKTRIMDADEPARSSRLWLISQIEHILTDGLDILGIPVPEKM